jgi:hypothetical protein
MSFANDVVDAEIRARSRRGLFFGGAVLLLVGAVVVMLHPGAFFIVLGAVAVGFVGLHVWRGQQLRRALRESGRPD